MRLVLDTDVVLSGLLSRVGASRILLLAIDANVLKPLVSVATLIEYEAVLKRANHLETIGWDIEEVGRFLDGLVARADHVIPHYRIRPSVRDPDDEIFAELAINGQADALVTFNVKDYQSAGPTAVRLPITVCRPGDILRRLSWRP